MINYAVAPNHISSEVAGEIVILNHKEGLYYSLDQVGAVVWQALQAQPQTLATLVEAVTTQFEVSPQTCETDVKSLLDDLVTEKIVTLQ